MSRMEEIRERAEKATEGPWAAHANLNGVPCIVDFGKPPKAPYLVCHTDTKPPNHLADTTFIAHARADIPWLLAEVQRLREALEAAEETLRLKEFPSRPDPIHGDEIKALGSRIGYGALMSSASASWREYLAEKGTAGGEFVAGPCQGTVTATLARIRAALGAE